MYWSCKREMVVRMALGRTFRNDRRVGRTALTAKLNKLSWARGSNKSYHAVDSMLKSMTIVANKPNDDDTPREHRRSALALTRCSHGKPQSLERETALKVVCDRR
jgi:hypothetical protein